VPPPPHSHPIVESWQRRQAARRRGALQQVGGSGPCTSASKGAPKASTEAQLLPAKIADIPKAGSCRHAGRRAGCSCAAAVRPTSSACLDCCWVGWRQGRPAVSELRCCCRCRQARRRQRRPTTAAAAAAARALVPSASNCSVQPPHLITHSNVQRAQLEYKITCHDCC
jgi:hypothetical protein